MRVRIKVHSDDGLFIYPDGGEVRIFNNTGSTLLVLVNDEEGKISISLFLSKGEER